MIRTMLILAGCIVATTAAAQTTTNCSASGDEVTCNSAPNGFYVLGRAIAARRQHQQASQAFVSALSAGRCVEAQSLAAQFGNASDREMAARCVTPEAAEAASAREADQALTSQVALAVREGRCQDAKNAALDAHRLDLADQAMRLCTPPSQ